MAQVGVIQHGKRRTHHKVRTGCITCKIRRVKCDEEKPSCRRCRNTGRKCDGYADVHSQGGAVTLQSQSSSESDETGAFFQSNISIAPKRDHFTSPAFEFFHAKTLPAVSGFIDTELWSCLILQLGETETAIKSAITALSCFHELIERHGFDHVGVGGTAEDAIAVQHYNTAISKLCHRLAFGPASKTLTLACCLIFTCVEFLRGEREAALAHLKNGVNILRLQQGDSEDCSGSDIIDDCLAPAFSRMSLIQTIYGQPRESRYMDLLLLPTREVPEEFTTLDTARNAAIHLTNTVMSVCYQVEFDLFLNPAEAKVSQFAVSKSVEQWMLAFEPMLDCKDVDQRAAQLLKSIVFLDRIWISRCLMPKNESAFDDYFEDFQQLVDAMETVLGDGIKARAVPSFTIDTGMISTLFYTAIKCRKRKLRRGACELIKKCPRREGLFDSAEMSKVAEFIIETEERDLPPLPSEDLPEEEARVSDYRIVTVERGLQHKIDVHLHHGSSSVPETLLAMKTIVYGDGYG